MNRIIFYAILVFLATVSIATAQVVTTKGFPEGSQTNNRTVSADFTTGTSSVTLAAVSGKFTYLCGFTITTGGTTAAITGKVTITGTVSGTMSFTYVFVSSGQGIMGIAFPGCITSSGTNTAIVVNTPAGGAGGDGILVATSLQAGATALTPLGQYSFRSYAPTSAQGGLAPLFAWGKIISLTVNVTQAYTGSGSATLQVGGQFNNFQTIKQSDWSDFIFAPQINLKQAGERIITPSGVTCNGVSAPTGCSGDSLGTALPEAVWIGSNITQNLGPYMGSTFSGGTAPTFTMTLRTNQGVVP